MAIAILQPNYYPVLMGTVSPSGFKSGVLGLHYYIRTAHHLVAPLGIGEETETDNGSDECPNDGDYQSPNLGISPSFDVLNVVL